MTHEAEAYFGQIAALGGFELPDSWSERVERFSRGELSATFASIDGKRDELNRQFSSLETHARQLVLETCHSQLAEMGYS